MSSESLYRKRDDDYGSPKWLWDELLAGWFDPCPLNPTSLREFDGLGKWPNRTKVNPPYSNPEPWVDKAIQASREGKTVALLLKHDSSTRWWAKLHEAGAHFLPIMGRLKFPKSGKPAPFPSILVVLGGSSQEFPVTEVV